MAAKRSKQKRRRQPQPDSPERARLRVVLAEVATIQRKLRERFHSGLTRKTEPTRHELAVAQEMVQLLASRTWESIELAMTLTGELPERSSCYHAAGVGEWAKVRHLASGRFQLEAFDQAGQGVLAEVDTWELLAAWQPCSAADYRAQVQQLLDGAGIQWQVSNMEKVTPLHPKE